ncbi:Gfo/Idh/MocA family protein [Ideonella livida]|uniref:Gfo/Idh/MocA family oxidoreductase n=1 Tax=Ideonella livida TaxID=2707176 RepID=A0A7C9TN99_9BURK|nr:Gfo/Idh/MocA family oxidoreductase [Ideonella livida]NDY93047.1 Gfo/Idh/MocA family oxidoreductase [Ideonella livida]
MLQIALSGAGQVGREHARRLAPAVGAAMGARLHSVVDPSPAGAALAAEQGVPHHRSLDELLAAPLPDAVILATPNDLHVPQALALLRRGVPVLIEKPVAHDLAAGQTLVEKARQSGVPVLVGHHRRHSALLQAAKASVVAGELGRLVAVNTTVLFHKPRAYFEAAWRTQSGGGPILINLVHELDTLRWLAGEVVAVQARAGHAQRHLPVEDSAAVLLEFASGALGTLIVSDSAACVRSWEQTSGENPAYARDDSQDCLLLAGTRGSLAVPTLTRWQVEQGAEASWNQAMRRDRLSVAPLDPLTAQLQHFVEVVKGRAEPLVRADDALASLRLCLAVHEASRSGQVVRLAHVQAGVP